MRYALTVGLISMIAVTAQADTVTLPADYLSDEQRARFRECRAAIIIESSIEESERTVLPPAVVKAMREQVAFIMSETIFNVPALNYEDGAKRLDFTEQFIIDFGRTVGTELPKLGDRTERARILIDCQPLIWAIVKERIDILMQWRRRALGLDRPFPAEGGAVGEGQ